MPNFEFDTAPRRAYQEPQTTKKELLREPCRASDPIYGAAHNGGPGLSDLVATKSSWRFDRIDDQSKHQSVPPEREVLAPSAGLSRQKRANVDPTAYEHSSKRVKDAREAVRVPSLTTSSDERYGRRTGVIDLTADSDESDQEQILPEQQPVPNANYGKQEQEYPTRHFVPDADDSKPVVRQTSPSPPRTFTRGLSPIAAHPRRAPIMTRCKPPIKPASRRQTPHTASSNSLNVFHNNQPRSPEVAIASSRNTTPTARSTPRSPFNATSTIKSSFTMSGTPLGIKKSGPFMQEDDSSSDDQSVAPQKVPRDSVAILANRPKCDTPVRADISRLQAESKSMRDRAQQKHQSDFVTPSLDQSAIENQPVLDGKENPKDESFLDLPHQRTM